MFEHQIWDSHIHLTEYPKEEIPLYLDKWYNQGIKGILSVATDLRSSYDLLEWKAKYPNFIQIALGYHPEQVLPSERDLGELISLIHSEKKRIAAIGEVGLVHYRIKELGILDISGYMELLEEFSLMANDLNKPVILHAVHDKAIVAHKIIESIGIKKAHFHWFKSTKDITRTIADSGYYISFTPEITFRERDQKLARDFPLQQILLETDGPWPLSGKYADKLSEPYWIRDSIESIATIKNLGVEEVAQTIKENFYKLYLE